MLYELVPRSRRAAYVAFHNVGTAAGVFAGAMIGASLELLLPPRRVLFGASNVLSSLLYLFALSGLTRAILATLLARRVREFRKPRRALSAPALVMRVTGFNAMLGMIYDFIGRIPPPGDGDAEQAGSQEARAERGSAARAPEAKSGDNAREQPGPG